MAREAGDGGRDRAERYLRQAQDVQLKGDVIEVVAPSAFVADLISRRIGGELCRVASESLLDGRKVELRFRIAEAQQPAPTRNSAPAPVAVRPREVPPKPRTAASGFAHRLEDFIVGASNRLAFAAAVRLAEDENVSSLSPLFIYSPCGMGKTHLLHGIAARFSQKNPGAKVRCVSAETFTNEFIVSLKAGAIEGFRRAHRKLALLCIDDVHFLANKEATQTELLHTLDAVGFDRSRIALASDEHPRDIRRLSSALSSRFMSGAVLRIEEPDAALRAELAATLARRKGVPIDESGARTLVAANWHSVRELEGLLMQIIAVSRLIPEIGAGLAQGGTLDGGAVRRALEMAGSRVNQPAKSAGAPANRPRRPVPISIIQNEVARGLRVELSDMAGKGRHKRVVLARSIVVHLSRRLTTLSFPEIARAMGRPNHSSVITAHNRLLEQLKARTAESAGRISSLVANVGEVAGREQILEELGMEVGAEIAGLTLTELCEGLEREVIRQAESL